MINWAGEEREVNDHRYHFPIKETVATDKIQAKFAFEQFKKHTDPKR